MSADSFTSDWHRTRVVFGIGARRQIAQEIGALGSKRAVIVAGGRAQVARDIQQLLGDRCAGVLASAVQHVPRESVTAALLDVDRLEPDAIVAVGGGSPIGLAKAIALERTLPIVALPTTYAGSEMTSIYGITEDGAKKTGRNASIAPRLVIYDPELTVTLSADDSAASGMNAVAHAVEAMYSPAAGPIAIGAATEALRLLGRALPPVIAWTEDLEARALAMRGAHAAGVALELATMGLHHKICHVLGGAFGLPHAMTHAVLLRHVVAFNEAAAPEAMARIAEALGARNALRGIRKLTDALGIRASLGTLGLRAEDIPRAADLVVASAYPNPRTAATGDVRKLLAAAL